MDTVVSSLFIRNSLDTIKFATLYCDKIVIPESASAIMALSPGENDEELKPGQIVRTLCVASWSTVSPKLKKSLRLLEREGLITYSSQSQTYENSEEGAFFETFDELKDTMFYSPPEGGLRNKREYDELARVVLGHSYLVRKVNDFESYYDRYDLAHAYFSFLAETALSATIHHGCPVLTDSRVVNELISRFTETVRLPQAVNRAEQQSQFLMDRILQEFLPNVRTAHLEDVLELRLRMDAELQAFRSAVAKLSINVKSNPWSSDVKDEADKIIVSDVKPALVNLKAAFARGKLQLLQRIAENVKHPEAYIAFAATVYAGVQPALAALAGAGLVGAKILLETINERKKLEDTSGLVFLLEAPTKLQGMIDFRAAAGGSGEDEDSCEETD